MRFRLAVLALALASASGPAGAEDEDPLAALSGADALAIAKALSTDAMKGRKTGFDGGKRAADYVAQAMGSMGLDPKDPAGTYLDEFEFPATQVKAPIAFSIGDKALEYGTDYVDLVNSGQGRVEGEVVFVGYGISAPAKSFDEYAGLDVKGKVVLALTGAPKGRAVDLAAESRIGVKSALAHERGAKAFLLALMGARAGVPAIAARWLRPNLPAVWVSDPTADRLLAAAKTSLEAQHTSRDVSATALAPVATGTKVALEVNVDHLPRAKGYNALGAIRGSDPGLRREVVLVGAHMDHLGVDAQGRVYNGAHDNASGTGVLLHVARTLVEASWKPKRMVLFVAWGASDQEYVGSSHLAEALPFEHDGIVCLIDVVRVGQGELVLAGGDAFPEMGARLAGYLPAAKRRNLTFFGRLGDGDADVFARKGMPAFELSTMTWPSTVGTPADDVEHVKPESLEAAAKVLGALVVRLGEEPEPLKAKKTPEAPR